VANSERSQGRSAARARAPRRHGQQREEPEQPAFVFLHLGKTGGGSVRQLLRPIRSQWAAVGHHGTLDEIHQRWPEAPIVFFVRDPVTRFVSGFNNFRRAVVHKSTGKLPSQIELVAHTLFTTANELAEGLASNDPRTRSAAEWAVTRLGFLRNHLTANLHSAAAVDRHRPHLALIGLFERFDVSVSAMRAALDLPPTLRLPTDESTAHRGLRHLPTRLSPVGHAAVAHWYRADIELYAHCRTIHHEQTSELVGE